MPKLKKQDPKNCRDRNQSFSWYNGKRIYHGTWGTPEAKKNYRRIAYPVDNSVFEAQRLEKRLNWTVACGKPEEINSIFAELDTFIESIVL